MSMKIRDLIVELETIAEQWGDDTEVRFASQPRWALEYSIDLVNATTPVKAGRRGKHASPAVAYLAEGSQIGYLPHDAAVAIGWADGREDDEDDDDEGADVGGPCDCRACTKTAEQLEHAKEVR